MHDKVTYEYAVIRVMPKVERGEFFNVGVILFSKTKEVFGCEISHRPNKAGRFYR